MSDFMDIFVPAVKKMWPRYRATLEELHAPWIKYCSARAPSDVALAFELCKKEFPDAPNWERIISWLKRERQRRREARERLERNGDVVPVYLLD